MLNDQSIKSHPLYPEYAQMRIRERKLLCDEEEIRGDCKENKDFQDSCRTFASARKKLDDVEQILREETA